MARIDNSLLSRLVGSRNRYLLALDALLLPISSLLAVIVRFEGLSWPELMPRVLLTYVLAVTPLKLYAFLRAGLYGRLWRYAGAADLQRIVGAAMVASAASAVVGAVVLPATGIAPFRVPLSVLVLDALLMTGAAAGPRLLVRLIETRRRMARHRGTGRRALIVGAGAAGRLITKELDENPQLGLTAVGFVDDDQSKLGRHIADVPVLGTLAQIEDIVAQYAIAEVIIAMPAAPGAVVREVVRATSHVGVPTRTVPGLFELISGRRSVSALRHVEIEDLLRRSPIRTDLDQVRRLATGEVVLVTGAGGSIGGELCRQVARLRPRRLVALGRGENSIFELLQELSRDFPDLDIQPVIADVRDTAAMAEVFRRHRPFTVFHAAAHKHVPLMEQNPAEAVLNNVLGTENAVRLAAEHGTEHFVLISTDKAVRPTSIMGATKRIAESVVQDVARQGHKRFVSVRFGNVLGSRGSVVPTFLRQIAAGGPVTVTHPEMRRYFMTIPEAVQLVLQAGALGEGSETFVLDMGEPVKIVDLATDLIRLSGYDVGRDIEIRFTEMRPGEKLYEELFFSAECATPTVHPKVLCAKSIVVGPEVMMRVQELTARARQNAPAGELRRLVKQIVPDYQAPIALAETAPEGPRRPGTGRDLRPSTIEVAR